MSKKIWQHLAKIYFLLSDKQLMHFAASLSFHTVLSIIPVLLVSLSIFTKLPNFDEYYIKIKEFIFSSLLPSHSITNYIEQFLSNSNSLGMMGFIAVIFTSIMFFSDYNFVICRLTNTRGRGFWRNLSNYWTMITLMPLALGFSFWVSSSLQTFLEQNEYTSGINLLLILPYLIVWAIFSIAYLISINKELNIAVVVLSSFFSSLAWFVLKLLFVEYVFYNKIYTSIYGSFSILLFFFVWIYISWIIFLYGVKFCSILDEMKKEQSKAKTGENLA